VSSDQILRNIRQLQCKFGSGCVLSAHCLEISYFGNILEDRATISYYVDNPSWSISCSQSFHLFSWPRSNADIVSCFRSQSLPRQFCPAHLNSLVSLKSVWLIFFKYYPTIAKKMYHMTVKLLLVERSKTYHHPPYGSVTISGDSTEQKNRTEKNSISK
jgi:hypothetical protein